MKDRINRFMAGRYGNDRLNLFLLVLDIVLALIGGVIGGRTGSVIFVLVALVIVLIYYRMLSRQHIKRASENAKYMRIRYQITGWLKMMKERWVQRKDYKFFTCSACKTTLRVPRGKGKINIVCRKCGHSFQGRT